MALASVLELCGAEGKTSLLLVSVAAIFSGELPQTPVECVISAHFVNKTEGESEITTVDLSGCAALFMRDGRKFIEMAHLAEMARATAAIVINEGPPDEVFAMGCSLESRVVGIPVVMVSSKHASVLFQAAAAANGQHQLVRIGENMRLQSIIVQYYCPNN